MKFRTSVYLVPFALAAMGFALLTLSGCGKGEKPVDPASPESYMKDKAFRQKLSDSRKERNHLEDARAIVRGRMEELVAAKKTALGTDDRAKALEALKADPEWQTLEARLKDAEQAIRESRNKAFRTVRERLAPGKRDER